MFDPMSPDDFVDASLNQSFWGASLRVTIQVVLIAIVLVLSGVPIPDARMSLICIGVAWVGLYIPMRRYELRLQRAWTYVREKEARLEAKAEAVELRADRVHDLLDSVEDMQYNIKREGP